MSDHIMNDSFKFGSSGVELYTRTSRTLKKKSSVDDIDKNQVRNE
jgi:hypothetical protein